MSRIVTNEARSAEETVVISRREYEYLSQVVIDLGDIVRNMQGMATLFENSGLTGMNSMGQIATTLIKRPAMFKETAEQLIPLITSMGPYIQRYGRLAAATQSQQEEDGIDTATGAPGEPE